MNKCVLCDKTIEDNFSSLFLEKNSFCYKCFAKFKRREEKFEIDGVKGIVLYWYDEFFKDVLYQYKGCYDYLLKDVFLGYLYEDIKRKYRKYVIVLAPSNENEEEKRGFNHLENIFLGVRLPIVKCFSKNKKWKQSSKKIEERKEVQNIIKIDKTLLNGVKKVLIVDDVMTSGSTIKAMIRQIPSNIDKKVLVLASNCRFLANDFN